jgi:hypothetical protein
MGKALVSALPFYSLAAGILRIAILYVILVLGSGGNLGNAPPTFQRESLQGSFES